MKYRHYWTLEGLFALVLSSMAKSTEVSVAFLIMGAVMFLLSWTPWGNTSLIEDKQ